MAFSRPWLGKKYLPGFPSPSIFLHTMFAWAKSKGRESESVGTRLGEGKARDEDGKEFWKEREGRLRRKEVAEERKRD